MALDFTSHIGIPFPADDSHLNHHRTDSSPLPLTLTINPQGTEVRNENHSQGS